jgi:hypothetical protein
MSQFEGKRTKDRAWEAGNTSSLKKTALDMSL